MCHVTIITYHIIQKLALLCGNWKLQQRIILFMSAYQNNKETVTLNSSLSVFFLLIAVSTLKKPFNKEKIHSGLFLSLAITGHCFSDTYR